MKRTLVALGLGLAMVAGAATAEEWAGIELVPGVALGVLVEIDGTVAREGGETTSDMADATRKRRASARFWRWNSNG
jgi:hypothetical protein